MTVSSEWREERVLECFRGRHPLLGLVDQQLLNQVKQLLILCVHRQHIPLQRGREGGREITIVNVKRL